MVQRFINRMPISSEESRVKSTLSKSPPGGPINRNHPEELATLLLYPLPSVSARFSARIRPLIPADRPDARHDAVEDRVGDGGVSKQAMPLSNGYIIVAVRR